MFPFTVLSLPIRKVKNILTLTLWQLLGHFTLLLWFHVFCSSNRNNIWIWTVQINISGWTEWPANTDRYAEDRSEPTEESWPCGYKSYTVGLRFSIYKIEVMENLNFSQFMSFCNTMFRVLGPSVKGLTVITH